MRDQQGNDTANNYPLTLSKNRFELGCCYRTYACWWDFDGKKQELGILAPEKNGEEISIVSISPNPNTGQFQINYDGDQVIERIHLFDHTGKVFYVKDIEKGDTSKTFAINTEGLKGIYFTSIATQDRIIYNKVVIE